MKKLLVSLTVLALGLVGLAEAKSRTVGSPKHATGVALQTADYGGFDISTSVTSATHSTATLHIGNSSTGPGGSGVFAGVIFSESSTGAQEYIEVFDSSVTLNASNSLIARIYNVEGSTKGFVGPKYPIRFKNGLIWKPSVATYDIITVLYNQD